jgi:hypothetical protein
VVITWDFAQAQETVARRTFSPIADFQDEATVLLGKMNAMLAFELHNLRDGERRIKFKTFSGDLALNLLNP